MFLRSTTIVKHNGDRLTLDYNGFGELKCVSGVSFEGLFRKLKLDNERIGNGLFLMSGGEFYAGCFVDEKKEGNGSLIDFTKNLRYTGEFHQNMFHGRGTLSYPNGDVYIGEFKFGLRDGTGKLTCSNGAMYSGEWRSDEQHGHGEFIDRLGNRYIGSFVHNCKEGDGICKFVNGDTYTGKWSDDAKHGEGKYTYSDGSVYQGEFYCDRREGRGKFTDTETDTVYTGEWRDDSKEGQGRETIYMLGKRKRCAVYEGQFVGDQYHGHGVYRYTNGDVYRGQWRNGKQHGVGHYTYASRWYFPIACCRTVYNEEFRKGLRVPRNYPFKAFLFE